MGLGPDAMEVVVVVKVTVERGTQGPCWARMGVGVPS